MTRMEFLEKLEALKVNATADGITLSEAISLAVDLTLKYAQARPLTLAEAVDEAMASAIKCARNKTQAARRLGIDRRTLYRWLEKKRNVLVEHDGVPRAGS